MLSGQHKRAIANVKFAIMNRDSFVVITGEIGIGKTTILNKIYSDLGDSLLLARLAHTTLSPVELLQATLLAFQQPVETNQKLFLLEQIRLFLIEQYHQNNHVIIAIDEAQNLCVNTLEELRLLTCIDSNDRKLLTVVLVGQPDLNDLIDLDRLANLRQRTRLRQHLDSLTAADTMKYLRHRLAVAGGSFDNLFAPGTANLIYRVTLGNPRLINTLCDTAMMACAVEKTKTVTHEILQEALYELDWKFSATAVAQNSADTDVGEKKSMRFAVYTEDGYEFSVLIETVPFTIGSDTSNNLCVVDDAVLPHYAVINEIRSKPAIESFCTDNRLLINGRPKITHFLESGDVIDIGSYQIVFHYLEPQPQLLMRSLGSADRFNLTRDQNDRQEDSVPVPPVTPP
jgi:type II secretory pathway predicted ATPase ExeA